MANLLAFCVGTTSSTDKGEKYFILTLARLSIITKEPDNRRECTLTKIAGNTKLRRASD